MEGATRKSMLRNFALAGNRLATGTPPVWSGWRCVKNTAFG